MGRSQRNTRHSGPDPELLVSIDIGTTNTAVSLCILQPNRPPTIEVITSWPCQAIKSIKEPSVVCYCASTGSLDEAAFGSAAFDDPDVVEKIEEGNLVRVEWWKLLFRPDHLAPIEGLEGHLPAIPENLEISSDRILRDFLRYIGQRVQTHLIESHAMGPQLWQKLSPRMTIIMATPNGWEGKTRHRMRMAALEAKLVGTGEQVKFIDEAEASILYTLSSVRLDEWCKEGESIAMVDCGGGTIDITAYKIVQAHPTVRLVELSPPRCLIAGSVFVNQRAEAWIRSHLEGTTYFTPKAMENFERKTKRTFDNSKPAILDLGVGYASDATRGINRGRLSIPKNCMVEWFAPSLLAIIGGLSEIVSPGKHVIQKVVLGGGFANSPYLFSAIQTWAKTVNVAVTRPGDPLEKAVTNGGIMRHLNSSVVQRVTKFHYGIDGCITVRPKDVQSNPEIRHRALYEDPAGQWKVNDAFIVVAEKDLAVSQDEEFSMTFHRAVTDDHLEDLDIEHDLWAYRYEDPPIFMRAPNSEKVLDGFLHICQFRANLAGLYKSTRYQTDVGKDGKRFKYLEYKVCVRLGQTEVAARLLWSDKIKRKIIEGEVSIGYD